MSISNMASLKRSGRLVVCTSGNKIGVFQLGSDNKAEISIGRRVNQGSPKNSKKKTEGSDGVDSSRILAGAFSWSGQFFAVGDDNKALSLYRCGDPWQLISKRSVPRRCTTLTFAKDEGSVMLADKSGDVFKYSVSEPDQAGELVLGHLSMLLDFTLIRDDKFIATCDRDEKIRISSYPNAYNIHTYCLGHTEFVTRLLYMKEDDVIVSGGGDGSVRLWSCDGEELSHMAWSLKSGAGNTICEEKKPLFPAVKCLCYCPKHRSLIVTYDNRPQMHVYSIISKTEKKMTYSIDLKQELVHPKPPWDVCLDDSGLVWTLLPVEGETVSLWRYKDDQLLKIEDLGTTDPDISTVVDLINKDWQFFKDSLDVENIYSVLRRARVDNMKEYMERKQQRIKGKDGTSETGEKPPPKKVKIS